MANSGWAPRKGPRGIDFEIPGGLFSEQNSPRVPSYDLPPIWAHVERMARRFFLRWVPHGRAGSQMLRAHCASRMRAEERRIG